MPYETTLQSVKVSKTIPFGRMGEFLPHIYGCFGGNGIGSRSSMNAGVLRSLQFCDYLHFLNSSMCNDEFVHKIICTQ